MPQLRFRNSRFRIFKELIEKEHIDCDFTITRTFNVFLNVFLNEEQVQRSKAAYERLVTVGLEELSDALHRSQKRRSGLRC